MIFSVWGKRSLLANENLSSITVIENPTLEQNFTKGFAI